MKKAFSLLLFVGLAELLVGQNLVITTNPPQVSNLVIQDDMEGIYNGGGTTEITSRSFAVPAVNTEGFVLVSESYGMVTPGVLRSSTFGDLVWRPVSDYTIFDSGLNLEVFEKEVQIRYNIYEIAAESAISGDAETEGMIWFVVERMTEPDFATWYSSTFPAMLEILSIPESTSVEDIGVAEKAQRLKKRLFSKE